MRRRRLLMRITAGGLVLAAAGFLPGFSPPSRAEVGTCPQCGAPLPAGATFCGQCGYKLSAVAAPQVGKADPRDSVVQVVTAHDKVLTSTLASLLYESDMRIDSILGSAFAVGPGEFITDNGILVGAKEIALRRPDGRSVPARIVGADAMIGVALLQADLPEPPPLALRVGVPAQAGEPIRSLGYPSAARAGADIIVSAGVISGLHRASVRIHPIEDYLQTDASLPRGLAGGPWLDAQGRVIGMSTGLVLGSSVFLGPQSGIGFAIPSEWIEPALAWIRGGGPARGWLGAYTVTADFESRKRYGLPPEAMLVVEQVFPESPAAVAGLRRGDGLMKINGGEVVSLVGAQRTLLTGRPGEPVDLVVNRGGEILKVALTLVPRPAKPRLSGVDSLRFFGEVEVAPGEDGRLAVTAVTPGSYTARAKIAPGDELQKVLTKKDWDHGPKDNARWRSVRSVGDLESYLANAYSDFDFFVGVRFRCKDDTKRELFLWEFLTPTGAL